MDMESKQFVQLKFVKDKTIQSLRTGVRSKIRVFISVML